LLLLERFTSLKDGRPALRVGYRMRKPAYTSNGNWRTGRPVEDQTGQKSASVYECLPFIWPYNAHPGLLAQPYMYWQRGRNEWGGILRHLG